MISDCCNAPLAYGTEPFDGFGMCGECYEMSEVIEEEDICMDKKEETLSLVREKFPKRS